MTTKTLFNIYQRSEASRNTHTVNTLSHVPKTGNASNHSPTALPTDSQCRTHRLRVSNLTLPKAITMLNKQHGQRNNPHTP